jgi:cell wall-associated NlpC family hydrolase
MLRSSAAIAATVVALSVPAGAEGAVKWTVEEERALVVEIARSWLGVRYLWGGTTRAGVDCSGFVQRVFRAAGFRVPRTTWGQIRAGRPVARGKILKADLLFFGDGGHVAIYLGNGRIIHSPYSGSRVRVERLRRSVLAARRIVFL